MASTSGWVGGQVVELIRVPDGLPQRQVAGQHDVVP
jgi:hypothetical protein